MGPAAVRIQLYYIYQRGTMADVEDTAGFAFTHFGEAFIANYEDYIAFSCLIV